MDKIDKQRFIRQVATRNIHDPDASKVLWSRHAVAALINDHLQRRNVEDALQHCQVIEDYPPSHRPLPDCLVLAILADGRPIHVVAAVDESNDRIFIVTVYIPTNDRWRDGWQTRKR